MDNSDKEGEESSPSEINERIWNEVLEVAARAAKKTGFLTGESTFSDEAKAPELQWQEFYSSLSERDSLPEPLIFRRERVLHESLQQPRVSRSARSVLVTIFSVLLFVWGVSSCVMGLAGIMLGTFAKSQQYGTAAGLIELVTCLVSVIGLVLLLILRKRPRLNWSLRLMVVSAASVLGFIGIVACVALTEATHIRGVVSPEEDLALGVVVLIYGLIVTFISFW